MADSSYGSGLRQGRAPCARRGAAAPWAVLDQVQGRSKLADMDLRRSLFSTRRVRLCGDVRGPGEAHHLHLAAARPIQRADLEIANHRHIRPATKQSGDAVRKFRPIGLIIVAAVWTHEGEEMARSGGLDASHESAVGLVQPPMNCSAAPDERRARSASLAKIRCRRQLAHGKAQKRTRHPSKSC